jgi:hypothetical protein
MALTPEIDELVARLANVEALITALDGVQIIHVTIGTYNLDVDPMTMTEAYNRGADVLRSIAHGYITDLRNAVAETAIAQVAQP